MSVISVSKEGNGDEYFTPKYVVEILLPYLELKRDTIKTIWCPCDKRDSEYVKVLKDNGYNVIYSHIDEGKDFLEYEPDEDYDAIITNPPFSIKNKIFARLSELGKPFAILMSSTSVQSASFIRELSKFKELEVIMFDKRISYSGSRPPFPSWYFTDQLLDGTKFYIYDRKPTDMYDEWVDSLKQGDETYDGR